MRSCPRKNLNRRKGSEMDNRFHNSGFLVSRSLEVSALCLTSADKAFLSIVLDGYRAEMERALSDPEMPSRTREFVLKEVADARRLSGLLTGESA
jgi:hypothetical protein